jgi:hypothetical protein
MRTLLLAGASLLALLAAAPTASAATKTFVYIDGVVEYTVPASGEYEIAAYGAQGGSTKNNSGNGATGGKGALVSSHFNLTAGEVLQIAVGGVGGGGKYSGGGGGAAFVIGPDNLPLLIAGGGGGAGGGVNTYSSGYGGLISNDGGDGFGQQIHRGLGGGGGNGASGGGYGGGGGGGGFASAGSAGTESYGGGAGGLFQLSGGVGNNGDHIGFAGDGGFGGGGGGGTSDQTGDSNAACAFCLGGGGGGGGYSGGGGGQGAYQLSGTYYGGGGGGGGSFTSGFSPHLEAGVQLGNGEVIIDEFAGTPAVPEPGTLALVSTGLAGLAALGLRRRKA